MNIKEKVLLIEDERTIRRFMQAILTANGYDVLMAGTGAMADTMISSHCPDIIILDLGLPDMDGMTILKNVRKWSKVPILVVSARSHERDKVEALDAGADDYLTNPFNPLEAVARIQSNIRRFYSLGGHDGNRKDEEGHANLKVRDLELDTESCVLYLEKEPIELSSVEYRIMYMFMEHPGKVFTKGQIFQAGWNEEYMDDDNNVMVCISKLRAKLSNDGSKYIKTVRGLGYRLEK